jgi:hypothetical protein
MRHHKHTNRTQYKQRGQQTTKKYNPQNTYNQINTPRQWSQNIPEHSLPYELWRALHRPRDGRGNLRK